MANYNNTNKRVNVLHVNCKTQPRPVDFHVLLTIKPQKFGKTGREGIAHELKTTDIFTVDCDVSRLPPKSSSELFFDFAVQYGRCKIDREHGAIKRMQVECRIHCSKRYYNGVKFPRFSKSRGEFWSKISSCVSCDVIRLDWRSVSKVDWIKNDCVGG